MEKFNIPFKKNEKLRELILKVKKDSEINTLLKISNINAIDRMGYNDHGPTHVKIVANSSLRILRILIKKGILPNIVKNYKLKNEDAELVVVLASILHDIGHTIHRERHELLSTALAAPIIDRLLNGLYQKENKTIIKFETLHAIYSHEPNITSLTTEGGVVKIADALDMEKGRARIPYQIGSVNIHSLSAMAIEKVKILEGETNPVKIIIYMLNPAGIFQVNWLLKEKIKTSGIEKMFEVRAILIKNGKEKILKDFQF
jgi:hypothetical protein